MSSYVHVVKAPAPYTLEELARMARAPLEALGAERAVAFGSYARGEADGFSDLDLVVVMETERPRAERAAHLAPLLRALPLTVNLFVYTPAEYAGGMIRRLGIFDALARDGVEVYARPPR